MRLTRILAGVLSAAIVGLVPVSLAAPAHAADQTTVTTLTASRSLLEYKSGYSPFLNASVRTPDGSSVYSGTVDLYASEAGGAWKKISSKTASGYVSFSDVIPSKNTRYRVSYSGGSDYSNTYQPSQSADLGIAVARKFTAKGNDRTFRVNGKVTPQYGKKKIVIKVSKKQNKGFKKFKTIKTNKKGKFKVKLPKRRGTFYYSFTTKGDKSYVATRYLMTARVY